MDFLQTLKAHRGGLLRLKNQLYWYGARGWDGSPDRICLVLDADTAPIPSEPMFAAAETATFRLAAALLLIDGRPHWVWIGPEDVELIT